MGFVESIPFSAFRSCQDTGRTYFSGDFAAEGPRAVLIRFASALFFASPLARPFLPGATVCRRANCQKTFRLTPSFIPCDDDPGGVAQ